MKTKQIGFTLLELLVVLLIIGMLAAFVAPKYFGEIGKSQNQVAAAQISSISQALDQFRVDNNRYPTQAEGLAALYANPASSNLSNWNGPYLAKPVPPDPWGNAYIYNNPSTDKNSGKDYDVISCGPSATSSDGSGGGTTVTCSLGGTGVISN